MSLANDGASAAQIAKALEVEEPLVRAVLARNEVGEAIDRDINDAQLAALRQNAFQLAIAGENEAVRARMTMFLIERDKPRERREISPITAINKAIILANDQFKNLLSEYGE